jgi:hypothetical protein
MKKISGVFLVALIALLASAGVAQAQNLSWSTAARLNKTPIKKIACQGSRVCTVLDTDGVATYENTFAPAHPVTSTRMKVTNGSRTGQLACPTATVCVVGGLSGSLTAFDPVSRAKPQTVQASSVAIDAVACPRSTECVIVDATGKEQVENPHKLGTAYRTGVVSAAATQLSCPTTTECIAIGTNGAEAFNPLAPPQSSAVSFLIDGTTPMVSLSCPTAQDCNVLDKVGKVLTFDPQTLGTKPVPRSSATPAASGATGISCDAPKQCVVISRRASTREGNPRTGVWAQEPFKHHGVLTAVDCVTTDVCLITDARSWVYTGTTPKTSFVVLQGKATVGYVYATSTGVTATLSCANPGNVACTFVLRVRSAKGPVATRTVTLRTGRYGPFKVTLTPAQQATLRSTGKLAVAITVYQKIPGAPSIKLLHRTLLITV